jgi:hypothetical protein
MNRKYGTHCDWARDFSGAVYFFLSEVFSFRLGFSELGMTDHFVFGLARYARSTGRTNVEIFKVPPNVESRFGHDMDLFIQNRSGTYNWYALQAKIMSFNGAFRDIRMKSGQNQWTLLATHENTFGSKAYYLLYSGRPSIRPPTGSPTRSDCLGIPPIEELGLGIVAANEVGRIRQSLSRSGQFFFRAVYPDHIDSIRKLLCCESAGPITISQLTRPQIVTRGYMKIPLLESASVPEDADYDQYNESKTVPVEGGAPVRIIVNANG